MIDNGDTVYVCYEWENPDKYKHYATGNWKVAGIVADEKDANLWMEPASESEQPEHRDRDVKEMTLGMVEAFTTSNLD